MMRKAAFSVLLGVLLAGLSLVFGSEAFANTKPKKDEKKVALVVGVQEYDVERLKLANARKDAQEIAKALREIGFKVHLVTDPSREELGQTVAAFEADLEQADIGMFFYSGHGMQTVRPGSVEASNLLLPRDFRVPEVFGPERAAQMESSTVALEDVIKHLRQKARVGIVFLDACRDNPFAAEEIKAAQAEASDNAARRVSLSRGLSRTEAPGAAPSSFQPTPRVSQTTGMVIAYATEPGAVADDGAGDHSPFTKALLKRIKTPNRSIEQVLRDVATDVHSSTGGAQRPWVSASLLGGDLFLVPPNLGPGVTPIRPAVPALAAPITRPSAPAARSPSQAARPAPVVRRAAPAPSRGQVASRGGGGGGGRSSLPPGLGVGVGGGL